MRLELIALAPAATGLLQAAQHHSPDHFLVDRLPKKCVSVISQHGRSDVLEACLLTYRRGIDVFFVDGSDRIEAELEWTFDTGVAA